MRLVRRPKATALDVIHYHDIQEALESSQAILETGPYAVELTDKMILDLARGNIEQSKRMGFVQGDPAAILIVEYAGETEAEVQGQGRGARGPARRASASATPRTSPTTPPSSSPSGSSARPASGCSSAPRARRSPSPSSRTPRSTPSTCRSSSPRFREILAKHGARGRLLRPLLGGLPAHPPAHQPQDPARARAGAGHRRGDLRPRAGVRRRDLERARRRPRAQPVPRARLRAARSSTAFRELKRAFDPQQPDEPGQHRGEPGHHRAPALRARVQDLGAQDPPRLLRAGRLRGGRRDVQRRRGVPQEARGHHVPLVHGHARRGALDARPRQRAPRRAVGQGAAGGLHRPAALRGHGPLPRVQGVQGRVPVQRGHGEDEVRVPRTTTTRPTACRCATGSSAASRGCPGSARAWRRSRTGSRARAPNRWLMERLVGHRPAAAAAGLRARDLHRLVRSPAPAPATRRAARSCSSTTRSSPTTRRRSAGPRWSCWRPRGYRVELADRKCCGRPLISKGMLDEAQGARRVERRAPRPVGRARGAHRGARALLPAHAARRVRRSWSAPRTARAVARSSFLLEEFLLRERRAGPDAAAFARRPGARALLHGHCHQKALVGTAPTVAALRWAGFEVTRGGLRLLRHGGLVRLREGALRHLGHARQPAPRAGRQGRARPRPRSSRPGISCRQQIEHLAGRRAKHPAEVLREALAI